METPVIYFYTPKGTQPARSRSVFHKGQITEYYPMPDFPVFRAREHRVEEC